MLKGSWIALLVTMLATSAAAEVCDKVRPAWNPQNGSVGQVQDLFLSLTEPTGIIVVVVTAIVLLVRKRRLTITASSIIGIIVLLDIARWSGLGDQMIAIAYDEGCLTPPILTNTVFATIFLAMLLSLRRTSKV